MKTSPSHPTKMSVGVWIRVSTDDQARGESPQHHLERAKAYATAKGYHIREYYDLAGVSGKSVKEHAEAKRMLQDIKRGHIKGLIFSKLARLARNTKELLEFAETFQKQGAALISIEESFDTSTPIGLLFYTIIAAMAQWEREEIGSRVSASVKVRAKLGKPISGVAPFGYEWKDRKLVQHPERAPIRKLAYELFLKHRRKTTVARLLNQGGYRTRDGKEWYDTTVTRVLTDTSAKGVYYINRSKSLGNWKSEPKPESEWGTVECEPLVSEEVWNEVNRILEEQKKNVIRPGPRPKHLFSSLLQCVCGRRMYVLSNTPKYFCEHCKKRVPCADLEAIFLEKLRAYFGDATRITGYVRQAADSAKTKTDLLAATATEIAKVKDQMTKTHQLYLAGAASVERFKELNDPLEDRLRQLQEERVRLQAEVDVGRADTLSAEAVVEEALKLQELWPALDLERKRQIVQSLVQSITVDVDARRITLIFTCLPSSEETTNIQQRL
ncbi:MAG: recombinase family protein [Chthoniobacter sp.]|nr:recombinase family protein [Chthoniobacter sp.]